MLAPIFQFVRPTIPVLSVQQKIRANGVSTGRIVVAAMIQVVKIGFEPLSIVLNVEETLVNAVLRILQH